MVSRNCRQVFRAGLNQMSVCDKNVNDLGFNKKYNFKEPKNPRRTFFQSL